MFGEIKTALFAGIAVYPTLPKCKNMLVRPISREVYEDPSTTRRAARKGVMLESELIGDYERDQKCFPAHKSHKSNRVQFSDVHDISQQGKKKGDTFTWDVVSDVATAGGVLTETNTMPETNFTIAQSTLTITEIGNSIPYSGKLDNLSKFPVEDIIKKALKNDAVKAFDRLAWTQFNSTLLRVIASSGTDTAAIQLYTNGTVTGTNSIAYNNGHAKSLVDTLKERNIPRLHRGLAA